MLIATPCRLDGGPTPYPPGVRETVDRAQAPLHTLTRMADAEVYVVDRVTTRPGSAREFVDAYLHGYAPGARERGMALRHILVSPPIWFSDRPNVVTITWSLSSPRAWWEMTWKGRPDPELARWWESVDHLVVERDRSVAAAASDVDGVCDV